MAGSFGEAFGASLVDLPGVVPYDANPFDMYQPTGEQVNQSSTQWPYNPVSPAYGIGLARFGGKLAAAMNVPFHIGAQEMPSKNVTPPTAYNGQAVTYDIWFPQIAWRAQIFQPQDSQTTRVLIPQLQGTGT